MKKTDLAKHDAKKIMNKISGPGGALAFAQAASPSIDKREQRRRDQALGLVPFAVKLNGELVKQLHALATERGQDLNSVVAELLNKGLAVADHGLDE